MGRRAAGVFGEFRAPTGLSGSVGVGDAALDTPSGRRMQAVRDEVRRTGAELGTHLRLLVGKPGLDGHSNGAEQVAVERPIVFGVGRGMHADVAATVLHVRREGGLLRGVEHVAGGVEPDHGGVAGQRGGGEDSGVFGRVDGEAVFGAERLHGQQGEADLGADYQPGAHQEEQHEGTGQPPGAGKKILGGQFGHGYGQHESGQ